MRKKVPSKSHFELMKFLRENPDPLGVEANGGLKEYTMEEVSKHNDLPSVWTVYNGFVYDITMYLDYHPGGIDILKSIYGKDMTEMEINFILILKLIILLGNLKQDILRKKKVDLDLKKIVEINVLLR